MLHRKSTLFTALAALAAGTVTMAAPNLKPETFGMLKDTPSFIQEWHVWWGFPYPDPGKPFSHFDTTMTAAGEPWRLNWNRNGYPLVGLYDSSNREIIRWQMRCIKATGLNSVAVLIHPEWNTGMGFIQEEPDNMIQSILDIAAEENFPVFFMDEVAFRTGSRAQEPAVTAARIIDFIKRYGNHPGLLKLDGKPVYYFQTYGWKISADELQQILDKVDAATGGVSWMMFGPVTKFGKIPQLTHVVDGASLHRTDRATRQWQLQEQDPAVIFANGHRFGKKITDMQYPKFDGTGQPWRQTGVAQYGKDGKMLETTLSAAFAEKPDFIMLSSWNDWEEGANFEPGWDFDGITDDPYTYCRVIAHFKGVEFVPPPLPPKEAVHPTVWEKLGYGDGAGPLVEKIERSHVRGGSLAVTVRDTASEVTALEVVWEGDWFWKAPQAPDGNASGTLTVTGELPAATRMENVFTFSPGFAVPFSAPNLEFSVPADANLPERFAVGVADAFDPAKPLRELRVKVPNREPVRLREPKGGLQTESTLNLTPYPRDNQLPGEFWNGWRTNVAITPIPVAAAGKTLKVQAERPQLGLVAILGDPQEERALTEAESVTSDGTIKTFRFSLPDSVLSTPGAHFVWLRGRDSAGNWGSPRLYAVPNYEFYPRDQKAEALSEPPLSVPGARLADNCSDLKNWQSAGNRDAKVETVEQKQLSGRIKLGDTLLYRDFAPRQDGSFHLQLHAAHTSSQRKMILWLTDGDGKNGYGLSWDSAKPEQNNGTGVMQLLKITSTEPLTWQSAGTVLATASSGHPATGETPAVIDFRRDGKSGELTVSVDGKPLLRAVDPEFQKFGRLYLRGNRYQLIDQLVLN